MLVVACWVTLAVCTPRAQEPFASETWIPVDETARTLLSRGDVEAATAVAGGRGAELAWDRAFESWSAALRESAPGAVVASGPRDALGLPLAELAELFPDRDRTFERRHESIEYALLRRLAGLPREALDTWSAQTAPRAAAALARASRDATARARDLARIEREFPGTPAAARAALERFELAYEQGRPRVAESWLVRAERHARLARAPEFDEPLRARRAVLLHEESASGEPAWANASEFVPTGQHALVLPRFSKPKAFARIDGPAGIALLADDHMVVQTSDLVWVLAEHEEDRAFEPWQVARELGTPAPRDADRPGREWPLLPASDGEHIYIVAGRADGVTSNLVQKLLPPHALELPEVVWSLGGDGLYGADGLLAPLEELLGPGLWEFQPGPLLADDLLLVQARQWSQVEQDGVRHVNAPGEAKAWLLALERATGRPRWKELLARGTDVIADLSMRFGRGELIRTPAAAPRLVGHRVFAGTHLGSGALLDLCDGRLVWSFLITRREPQTPGWENPGPPILDAGDREAPVLLWAPRDATELYALGAWFDGDPGADPLLVQAPLAIGESQRLIGGDRGLALTYGRAGARRTLSAHELDTGRRYDSVFLGREERFLGRALVSEQKVLCLTDHGLYRFDRERELYLELLQPLALDPIWAAGGLWARGEQLLVLANGGLLRFEAR